MASTVKTDQFAGGKCVGVQDGQGAKLETMMRDIIDDISDLRTKVAALFAKLDADAGVTDTDYASTLALATRACTKG